MTRSFQFRGTLVIDGDAFIIAVPQDLAIQHRLSAGMRVHVTLKATGEDS